MEGKEVTIEELGQRENIKELSEEIFRLKAIVQRLSQDKRRYIIESNRRGNSLVFGLCGDVHCGSLYERIDAFNEYLKLCKSAGIKDIIFSGDLLDGHGMYRGQQFEQYATGYERQLSIFNQKVIHDPSITVHFVVGNHDWSFGKLIGIDIGKSIAETNSSWHYVGRSYGNISLYTKSGHEFKVGLIHPSGGTAYAISYRPQKIIEKLPGGQKPHMVAIGHYHKAEFLPNYRNVAGIQTGCFNPCIGIITKDGTKPIKKIKIGDKVLTHLGNYKKVIKTYKRRYEGKWVKIIFGRKCSTLNGLLATEEHPILAFKNGKKAFIQIKMLEIGDEVYIKSNRCKNCDSLIPYYNKFCLNCNPAMIGAHHKRVKCQKKAKNFSGYKHYFNDILPYCKKLKAEGKKITPLCYGAMPDAIEFKDDKIIYHEIENSNRPNHDKYEQFPELKNFYSNIIWDIRNGLIGNTQQNRYTLHDDMIRVPIISKIVKSKKMTNVYNLEVEDDNTYCASNVFVHNCFQSQTPYMLEKQLDAHIGGWIIDAVQGKLTRNVKAEFISFFEPED